MNSVTKAKLNVFAAMVIYGTIGLFVKNISMPSAVTAMFRGIIGAPFLIVIMRAAGERFRYAVIKKHILLIAVSGVMLGLNWIALFEAYNYTSVAVATLCYYIAPIMLVVVSPFFFGEAMTPKKVVCILTAMLGMVFVSGVLHRGSLSHGDVMGVVLGLAAAVLYVAIISVNKLLADIPPFDRTILQLAVSALVLLPYNIISDNFSEARFDVQSVLLLLIVGIVHTGIAYIMYFGNITLVPAQSMAIISYTDPVVAVILSALILKEVLNVYTVIGAVLIIGAAMVSELSAAGGRT